MDEEININFNEKKKKELYTPSIEEVKKLVKEKDTLKDEDYLDIGDIVKYSQAGLKDSSVLQGVGVPDSRTSKETKLSKEIPIPSPTPTSKKPSKIGKIIWIISFSMFFILFGMFLIWDFKMKVATGYVISFIFTIVILVVVLIFKSISKMFKNKYQPSKNKEIKFNDLEYADLKYCPICNAKIIKGKIIESEDKYKQILKCKNLDCDFQKVVEFGNDKK